MVTCDHRDDPSLTYVNFPKLVIEVLSPSNKNFNITKNLEFYRTIPTLENYLLIHTDDYKVDCFRRQTEDVWMIQFYAGIEAIAHLDSLDVDLPLTEIYEGVVFPKPENESAE